MKTILLVLLFLVNAYSSSQLETNKTCKGCHPAIYAEFNQSAHRKSSIYEDKIHKAVWGIHPDKAKNKYTCNECHTPSDTRITNALAKGDTAVPIENDIQKHEAISCVYCHSIKTIESHAKSNDKNILTDKEKVFYSANKHKINEKIKFQEEKSFFGMMKKTSGSPFHEIDYSNKNFYTGKICMGCHSNFENQHGQNLWAVNDTKNCKTCHADFENKEGLMECPVNQEKNCLTCHMPKVKGSATTIKITKEHTFHGFAGTRNKHKTLSKYLKFNFVQTDTGFNITVKNEATHNLLLNPLRLGKLNVRINNGSKTIKLNSITFVRILGKDGKPSMSWEATGIYKDTMLKANESRTIKYNTKVVSGNIIEVEFGYYLVNPEMAKALNLQNSKETTDFKVLKTKFFTVK